MLKLAIPEARYRQELLRLAEKDNADYSEDLTKLEQITRQKIQEQLNKLNIKHSELRTQKQDIPSLPSRAKQYRAAIQLYRATMLLVAEIRELKKIIRKGENYEKNSR